MALNSEWRRNNPEKFLEYRRRYQEICPELGRERVRRWVKANPAKVNARNAVQRARRRNAMPSWVDRAVLAEIYADAQVSGLTVDHIVPLAGETVCGLHVPWNPQLLTGSENSSKKNSFSPTDAKRV